MSDKSAPHNQPTASMQPVNDGGDVPPTVPMSGGGGSERSGDWIGPYKLMEVLGEGGFGVVYLAERREPMVQRVALKIIKPGMDSKAVIARFEHERQTLAVMDHPYVAKVLDGGVTPSGRPYFVMEHVKGEPITAYADRQRLTIKQRLELFIPVCEAVQHAHMKGIIHRDIKPSNILVAPGEGEGKPLVKVIDFGVAKAISHTLTEKTIYTERGQLIGTPEYMSPEQAEMGATDIDTRTDVYSLGVVLYELLSGTLPFDPKTLRSAGIADIQRIIREVEPPRPSTKLSTADDRTGADIANARQAAREKIAGELRRELEWVPMKALRKDRTRRYASAESLGADVRRYLDGKPLWAAPESRSYLLRKFMRKHRVGLSMAGIAAGFLLAGLAGTGWGLWRSQQSNAQLRRAYATANAAFQQIAEALPDRFFGENRMAEGHDEFIVNDEHGGVRGIVAYEWNVSPDGKRRVKVRELDAERRPAENGILIDTFGEKLLGVISEYQSVIDELGGVAGLNQTNEAAVYLPEIWSEPQRRADVLFQDGGVATPVPGGTLWTFGDTFVGTIDDQENPKIAGAISNTMAMLPAGPYSWPPRLEYLVDADGHVSPPLVIRADEDQKSLRLWPLAGVWLEDAAGKGQGRVYMFYSHTTVGKGAWNFKGAGTGLARASAPLGPYERLTATGTSGHALTGWPFDPSSLVRRDGWLYMFAPHDFSKSQGPGNGLLVARVREEEIEQPSAYEYYTGPGGHLGQARWSGRLDDAAPAAPNVAGQANVAWNQFLHVYLLTTSSDFGHPRQIRIRSSAWPWGPWSPLPPPIGNLQAPERHGEQTIVIYGASYHPELDEADGRVITITFCRSLKREWALTNPEGVRLDLTGATLDASPSSRDAASPIPTR